MKTTIRLNAIKLIAGLGLLSAPTLLAQAFNSGSDGTYGAIDVTNDMTLNIPSNGVFNCTTIRVREGQSLSFLTNALNTPAYLLAQGDVLMERNTSIYVTGQGYNGSVPGPGGPGGFAGGFAYFQGYP